MLSSSPKVNLNDPIFKPRPGWGGKLKIFLQKNSNFKNLGFLVLTLMILVYLFHSDIKQSPVSNESIQNDQIALTAVAGEGSTNLSRKALDIYLSENSQLNLNPEQRLYAEDSLTKTYKPGMVFEGETIVYSKTIISDTVDKALLLQDWQLANLAHLIALTRDSKNRE